MTTHERLREEREHRRDISESIHRCSDVLRELLTVLSTKQPFSPNFPQKHRENFEEMMLCLQSAAMMGWQAGVAEKGKKPTVAGPRAWRALTIQAWERGHAIGQLRRAAVANLKHALPSAREPVPAQPST